MSRLARAERMEAREARIWGNQSLKEGPQGGDCGPWTSAPSPPLANRSFPTQGKIRADVLEKLGQVPGVWTNLGTTLG